MAGVQGGKQKLSIKSDKVKTAGKGGVKVKKKGSENIPKTDRLEMS